MTVDTLPRTLTFAGIVALVCSAMVSTAVSILRPTQIAHEQIERNRVIVMAAGLMPDEDISKNEIVSRYLSLDAHVVDLESGAYITDVDARRFDHWGTEFDSAVPPTQIPIYLVREGSELRRIVLPTHGQGMWSTIFIYVTLETDLTTIDRVTIYRHTETPGIGDRINDRAWLAQWKGKKIYDSAGQVQIEVTRNPSGIHEVDLISGASITSDAVGNAIHDLFDSEEYRTLLERLRQREALQ